MLNLLNLPNNYLKVDIENFKNSLQGKDNGQEWLALTNHFSVLVKIIQDLYIHQCFLFNFFETLNTCKDSALRLFSDESCKAHQTLVAQCLFLLYENGANNAGLLRFLNELRVKIKDKHPTLINELIQDVNETSGCFLFFINNNEPEESLISQCEGCNFYYIKKNNELFFHDLIKKKTIKANTSQKDIDIILKNKDIKNKSKNHTKRTSLSYKLLFECSLNDKGISESQLKNERLIYILKVLRDKKYFHIDYINATTINITTDPATGNPLELTKDEIQFLIDKSLLLITKYWPIFKNDDINLFIGEPGYIGNIFQKLNSATI